MNPIKHILVVDDDTRLRRLLQQYLSKEGFLVTPAIHAADAAAKLEVFTFDAIVLDVMMPGESGISLAKRLKATLSTPILLLTALSEGVDRVKGLETGAEDYVSKPFEPRELRLRLDNMLKRATPSTTPTTTKIYFGSFCYTPEHMQLLEEDQPVHLTHSELTLLHTLALHAGHTLTREDLAHALYGEDDQQSANERSVDVQITRLRKKLEPDSARAIYIQTIRGEGYVLRGERG